MPRIHVVKAGECMSTIAARYGHASYRSIYCHSDNEKLRKNRPNPDVLLPGDEVVIPDVAAKCQKVRTDAYHVFVLRRPTVFLRFQLPDGICGSFTIELDGHHEKFEGSIRDAKIDVEVPVTAGRGRVTLVDPDGDVIDVISLKIGDLDPVDTVSGAQSRLERLGYVCGDEDGVLGPATIRAIKSFQRSHGMAESGELSSDTQVKLVEYTGV